jgi:hypothetical protein
MIFTLARIFALYPDFSAPPRFSPPSALLGVIDVITGSLAVVAHCEDGRRQTNKGQIIVRIVCLHFFPGFCQSSPVAVFRLRASHFLQFPFWFSFFRILF